MRRVVAAAAALLLAPAPCGAAVQSRDLLRASPAAAARRDRRPPPPAAAEEFPTGRAAAVRMDAAWRPNFAAGGPVVPLDKGVEYLRNLLQTALQIEHATIPAYLTALYSIPPGVSANATQLLRTIVIEEMLHMTNAANVLNAVGGHPAIDRPGFVPEFPGEVPFVGCNLSITRLDVEQAKIFRMLEEPIWGQNQPHPTGLRTVADLYESVILLMDILVAEYGEAAVFTGNASLQVSANSSRGEVVGVFGHKDAQRGIQGVVRQGEGGLLKSPRTETSVFSHKAEHAHYYRCNEMVQGRYYQDTDKVRSDPSGEPLDTDWTKMHDCLPNTKAADFEAYPTAHKQLVQFNEQYTDLLIDLHDVFNGSPERFMPTLGLMYELSALGRELMLTPAPGYTNKTLGPPWEWVANRSSYRGGWRGISL